MIKRIIDVLMTIVLICLMSYSLVGEANHEILGIAMFVLFVVHHILNLAWTKNIFKGKYTSYRIWQTVLVLLIFLCIICQMISGIAMSKHIFVGLNVPVDAAIARSIHMLGAYWGYTLMSLHLGLHLRVMFKDKLDNKVAKIVGLVILIYGAIAFIRRGIPGYMLLLVRFVYFDPKRIVFFFIDYVIIMIALAIAGHLLGDYLIMRSKKENV